MRSVLQKSVLFFGFLFYCTQSYAQSAERSVILSAPSTGAFSIIERSNWRRYDNGKYIGLVRNEIRASILPQDNNGRSIFYQGNFYVLQSTLRDMHQSAQAVDAIIPVRFEVARSGSLEIENDRGFPMMRGFPSFPNQTVTRGVKWRAEGNRAADPFNTGYAVIIPFIAEYEYRGTEEYNDTLVHRIYAIYGYNYRNTIDGHPYTRVSGNHKVDILIRAADGLLVFMRDELNVTYSLSGGMVTEFKGFTLTFGSGLSPLDRGEVLASLGNTFLNEAPSASVNTEDFKDSSIDLVPVPEGIKLTIRDIRFIPDSHEFLPEERQRLDLIANALKQIPSRTFLVEGHTASTGMPENEMRLSIERAKSIISELGKRGIKADRFIYKGWGGTKPVGDNSTDSGRSANRRVEITILE